VMTDCLALDIEQSTMGPNGQRLYLDCPIVFGTNCVPRGGLGAIPDMLAYGDSGPWEVRTIQDSTWTI
jgi:hypothetical protein